MKNNLSGGLKRLLAIGFLAGCFLTVGCSKNAAPAAANRTEMRADSGSNSATDSASVSNAGASNAFGADDAKETNALTTAPPSGNVPRTVRDFFNILPQEYFPLEGCEPSKDANCEQARRAYVKSHLEIEDTPNGYWKSGCDGAQSCLTLALFSRAKDSYVVAVHTTNEADEKNYFLEYSGGKWTDISTRIVPEFSDKNVYELPRKGTTVTVYKKNYPEPEYSERGAKIYELLWGGGKFEKK